MGFDPGFDDYIKTDSTAIYAAATDSDRKPARFALWGDGVRYLDGETETRREVRIRGGVGWVPKAALGGVSLLEYYFIDVGQGDGVLIKTPDFRHILIDGGYPRKAQPTGKSAADFVDWKFDKDYGATTIQLDAMISSHIDWDHFGGLSDILDVQQSAELNCTSITIDAFYHSGLSYWAKPGGRELGPYAKVQDRSWFTRVLDDRASAAQATSDGDGLPQLTGEWRKLIESVLTARTSTGTPTPIQRLNQHTAWLPGFAPSDPVSIQVLGPIGSIVNGAPAVLRLGSSDSQNTNGTSVLLRFDYGDSRVLMTGDLNAAAHRALLDEFKDQERVFACDVGKACHHGSDDVSLSFLRHVNAGCTVISSGDAEGHDHPRARIVAASGLTGHVTTDGDALVTPLVYSTELARSVQVGKLKSLTVGGGGVLSGTDLNTVTLTSSVTPPGALRASTATRKAAGARIMQRLIYGLVNIRTDGEWIVAATMNEGDGSFTTKRFRARF
jgi:beta-lactamase superfamily II metal-dependent hydrolase